MGRKGNGEEEDEEYFSRLLLTHHTLRSHTACVGYPRFEDDWGWFREESKYKIIEAFVIAAFPKEQQAILLVFYFSQSLLYGPCME